MFVHRLIFCNALQTIVSIILIIMNEFWVREKSRLRVARQGKKLCGAGIFGFFPCVFCGFRLVFLFGICSADYRARYCLGRSVLLLGRGEHKHIELQTRKQYVCPRSGVRNTFFHKRKLINRQWFGMAHRKGKNKSAWNVNGGARYSFFTGAW